MDARRVRRIDASRAWQRREERRIEEAALQALELVGLADRANVMAGSLPWASSGSSPWPAPSRSDPRPPLDEPAAGCAAPRRSASPSAARAHGDELTQILVEHDMGFVGSLASG